MPHLNPDRYLPAEPGVRRIARDLLNGIADLPILSPHGHTDPSWFAGNRPFANPSALLIQPDHYLLRLLYSRGLSMESLGIPRLDSQPVEEDPRRVWQIFADHYHLFSGTPSGLWLNYVFLQVFGLEELPTADNADTLYDIIAESLDLPEFLPRALAERFNIEVLATTDGAADMLSQHEIVRSTDWKVDLIPTFRPDHVIDLSRAGWREALSRLESAWGRVIDSYPSFIQCLEDRRTFFRERGATATDQAVETPFTTHLSEAAAEAIFQRALSGKLKAGDSDLFIGHMLMEMARMSLEDGMVMQIHAGVLRDHNPTLARTFGPDRGGDIPLRTEFTRNLQPLLERFGNEVDLEIILFTVDESTYARELAPLAGHYPSLRIGPAWWFHDSYEGMLRHRRMILETGSIYNTAGFNDDTRALLSIPARHDLSRRVDCSYLAEMVATHRLELEEARQMVHALTQDIPRQAYKLDRR